MPREVHPAYTRTEKLLLVVPTYTTFLDGTGAVTLIDSLPLGYRGLIEKITYVATAAHTGTSATQVFKVRKGGATGTVLATLTINLADVNAIGKFKSASVAAADQEAAKLTSDTDTISFTRDASGTAFTAGTGYFILTIAQRLQAKQ